MLMGVPAGIVCDLYRRVSSGATLQLRPVMPKERRLASAMIAFRYGDCSKAVNDAGIGKVRSSARNLCSTWGLTRR